MARGIVIEPVEPKTEYVAARIARSTYEAADAKRRAAGLSWSEYIGRALRFYTEHARVATAGEATR